MKKNSRDAISVYIGQRIKARRHSLGYTLQDLAIKTDISIQMYSKYEQGAAQMFSSALLRISAALSIDVDLLFPQNPNKLATVIQYTCEDGLGILRPVSAPDPESDVFLHKETIDLIGVFYKLPTPELRRALRAMVRAVASELPRTETLLGSQ